MYDKIRAWLKKLVHWPERPSTPIKVSPGRSDLRECRPYYLVPLLVKAEESKEEVKAVIVEDVKRAGAQISDIYIFSHGWHRNIFTGVAAYDRLISRFVDLQQRARIKAPARFNPLFIAMHWHSDPGSDSWVDPNGRRTKSSFMLNVTAAFRIRVGENGNKLANDAEFASDFEDIYQLLSSVSAQGTDFLDIKFKEEAARLLFRLRKYTFRDSTDWASILQPSKAAMVWRCYDEAVAQGLLLDQSDPPQSFNNPVEAIYKLAKFILAIGGTGLLVSHWKVLYSWAKSIFKWVFELPMLQPTFSHLNLEHIQGKQHLPTDFGVLCTLVFVLLSICLLTLLITSGWEAARTIRASQRSDKRDPSEAHQVRFRHLAAIVAWLPLQVFCLAPLLIWALLGYVIGGPLFRILGKTIRNRLLFNERYGSKDKKLRPAEMLARIANGPLALLRWSIPRDSQVRVFADTLANQVAFWEMQRKGVNAGKEAGMFIEDLLSTAETKTNAFTGARLHFIGHSFGGLVVCNAVRYLAEASVPTLNSSLHTLCLIEAAIASDWFEGEHEIAAKVNIGCMYSAYDTANGYMYPLGNCSRLAAGFVGMCEVGKGTSVVSLGKGGAFASLVTPPDLYALDPNVKWPNPPLAINLDASRIIFAGSPASGGGHDDIFKDDVVNLMWAVTRVGVDAENPPAPNHTEKYRTTVRVYLDTDDPAVIESVSAAFQEVFLALKVEVLKDPPAQIGSWSKEWIVLIPETAKGTVAVCKGLRELLKLKREMKADSRKAEVEVQRANLDKTNMAIKELKADQQLLKALKSIRKELDVIPVCGVTADHFAVLKHPLFETEDKIIIVQLTDAQLKYVNTDPDIVKSPHAFMEYLKADAVSVGELVREESFPILAIAEKVTINSLPETLPIVGKQDALAWIPLRAEDKPEILQTLGQTERNDGK